MLSTNNFGSKLAQRLPNLRVDVESTNVVPPALPPVPAPQNPLPVVPPPAPPGLPPSLPPPPSQTDFPILIALLAVFCTFLLIAISVIFYARTHPKNVERARKKASMAMTAIVPGLSASSMPAAPAPPVRVAWSAEPERSPGAASMHPSSTSDVEAMTVHGVGSLAVTDVGTSKDDLPGAFDDAPRASQSPRNKLPAVCLKATSAKLLQQIVAQSQEDDSQGDLFAAQATAMLATSRAASNEPPRLLDPAAAHAGMSAFACAAPQNRPSHGASCLPATLPAPTRPPHPASADVAGGSFRPPQNPVDGTAALPPAQDPLWIADLRAAADRRWAEFQQQRQQRASRAPMLAARFVARPQAQVLPSQRARSPAADAP